jgi:hypothetical protein
VLLLRPVAAGSGFARPATRRAPGGTVALPDSRVLAGICPLETPADDASRRALDEALADARIAPIARLETEPAENTFPRLPVRTGENVLVWFARFDDDGALRAAEARLGASPRWAAFVERLRSPPESLMLAPTARSRLA